MSKKTPVNEAVPDSVPMNRRAFVTTAGSAAAGLLLVRPATAFGSQANSALQLGMIGCGGRGTSVAESFVNRAGVRMAALADMFQDQLDRARSTFDRFNQNNGQAALDAGRLYKGPKAFQQLVDSNLDIVLISSPPYYHPEHLEAALRAKKNVYLEKPVATDVRGCQKVMELAKTVGPGQSVFVGFQIRFSPEYREMVRRIHEGAIGEIATVQGYYFAGDLPRRTKPGMPAMESKLRNWIFDRALSGDVLVEQNIHIIDWINWVLKANPERAYVGGSRKVRKDIGDVFDHFAALYRYPGDIRVTFHSTQFLPKWADVCVRFFGSKGFAEAHYSGGVFISGNNEWRAEPAAPAAGSQRPEVDPLREATPEKVKAFVSGIKGGKAQNELVQGAESTLSAILGRESAYKSKELTWSQLLKSRQQWRTDVILDKLG